VSSLGIKDPDADESNSIISEADSAFEEGRTPAVNTIVAPKAQMFKDTSVYTARDKTKDFYLSNTKPKSKQVELDQLMFKR